MELKNIVHFFADKNILITGGTGFLAKVMVEKILRVQLNVRKLYLLIRACDQEEAVKRFKEDVVGRNLFGILKEQYGKNINTFLSEKVITVAGDIAYENIGVKDSNLIEEMQRQVDVVENIGVKDSNLIEEMQRQLPPPNSMRGKSYESDPYAITFFCQDMIIGNPTCSDWLSY